MPSPVNESSWLSLLRRLGLARDGNIAVYRALTRAYSMPGRHYHNLSHIADCLDQLAACDIPGDRSDVLALAIWFHDAIYDWRSATNEVDSAAWASSFLRDTRAPSSLSEQVEALILATRHFVSEPLTGDSALVVDIDLSILGRSKAVYDRYEEAIRLEYIRVPKTMYRRGRRQVLRSFLDRERIFITDRFFDLYEGPARQNIAHAIRSL